MTLTLYPEAVVIRCDHPECGAEVMAVGGGEVRSLAKACGWRERDRPMWLDRSPHTVDFHRKAVQRKLGVATSVQAVAECIRRGLIQ